jgi:hypothetical protein
MTQTAIQKQLDAIKTVTEKALKSKEASRQILINAGLIKETKSPVSSSGNSKK